MTNLPKGEFEKYKTEQAKVITSLYNVITELQTKLEAAEMREKQLTERLTAVENESTKWQSELVNKPQPISFADILKNNDNAVDTTMQAIVRNVRNELKIESKIERNVVVYGLSENSIEKEVDVVKKLLDVLELDESKVVSSNRLRKRGAQITTNNPVPLLVEFVDSETRSKALKKFSKATVE